MNKHRVIIVAVLTVALVAGGYLVFRQVTKPRYAGDQSQRLSDVNYEPGTNQDNEETEKKKESGELANPPASPSASPTDSSIGISFVAAGQDETKGPLIVKPLLTSVTAGSCDLTVTRGDRKISRQAKVLQQSNYYTCEGFEVPFDELEAGDWKVTLTVKRPDGKSNAASTNVSLR